MVLQRNACSGETLDVEAPRFTFLGVGLKEGKERFIA